MQKRTAMKDIKQKQGTRRRRRRRKRRDEDDEKNRRSKIRKQNKNKINVQSMRAKQTENKKKRQNHTRNKEGKHKKARIRERKRKRGRDSRITVFTLYLTNATTLMTQCYQPSVGRDPHNSAPKPTHNSPPLCRRRVALCSGYNGWPCLSRRAVPSYATPQVI